MTFPDFEARFAQLSQQYQQRQLSPQAFAQAVNQLRLQGPDGAWWQMDQNGAWLRWDGRAWFPATPPRDLPPQPPAAQPYAAPSGPMAYAAPAYAVAPGAPQRAAPTRAAAMHTRPERSAGKPPESLLDLLKLLLQGMFKNIFVKLFLAFATLMFVWVLHTILLIGPNGGFGAGTNWVLDAVLALQGRMASGSLFWGLFFGLLSMVAARTWQLGPAKAAQSLITTPRWLVDSFRQSRLVALPLFFGNAALTLIVGTILDNRLVALLLVGFGLVELTAQANSLPGLLARLGWSDTQRLLGGARRPFNPGWTAPAVVGSLVGFMAAVVLPFVPWCGYGGAFILLAMMGLTVALLIMQPRAGVATLVFFLLFFATVTPVLADDGGWSESGGTLLGWLQSEGAVQAVLQGLPPAAAAALLGWLATTLGQSLGTVYGPGVADIKPGDLAAALPTAQGLTNLANSLEGIDELLTADGIRVRNFWQGDPIYVVNWINQAGNQGADWTMNNVFNRPAESITCEGYVDKTFNHVKDAVNRQFPGAKVESILFEEKSSQNPNAGWGNWFDSFGEENHNLIKVTLPNGQAYSVDFHGHNSHMIESNKPPIMRPWNESEQEWRNYLGANEFTQSVVNR